MGAISGVVLGQSPEPGRMASSRADSWKDFADGAVRQQRLRELVAIAHRYGIAAGIDVPIALAQQHSYRLVRTTGALDEELAQIRERLDWVMAAGFDFVGTESGTSEFTHPTADQTLAWMNEVGKHVAEHYGKQSYIKIHCSTGQTADGYLDSGTGQPIIFNMLAHFADPRVGILPHTVEHYGLTDPAPTYGNTNFGYMRTFLQQEVGRRPVVFYPVRPRTGSASTSTCRCSFRSMPSGGSRISSAPGCG